MLNNNSLNSKEATFYESVIDFIVTKKVPDYSLIVGLNGVDGSGKTTMARTLEHRLKKSGHKVLLISVDDFHNPRSVRYKRGELSPIAFCHDSINYDAIANNALKPAFEMKGKSVLCQTKLFDLALDEEDAQFEEVTSNTILLVEGIFLFRPEICPFLHVKIFLDVLFENVMQRVLSRDIATLSTEANIRERYSHKYIPGQMLYLDEVSPQSIADVVIDKNDFESAKMFIQDKDSHLRYTS